MTTDTPARPGEARETGRRSPAVLRPNLFGIPLGLAGLALCWSAAYALLGTSQWPAQVLWLLTAGAWAVLTAAYSVQVLRGAGLRPELDHRTFGPFTALPAIILMLLGGALGEYARPAGQVVFIVGLVATVAVGAYLSGQWIVLDLQLSDWHPGYFIPTVAGGLVAATTAATLGFPRVAPLMFGYGAICWLVLGSIILLRLFTQPALPAALAPTMAIEVAPPAIAGNAWFAMSGGEPDTVAWFLAGYGMLMVLVQIRLIPVFLSGPFGPGTWAFAFSYAAAVAVGLRWLAAVRGPGWTIVSYALLLVLTLGMLVLLGWTVRALVRGTFLPR